MSKPDATHCLLAITILVGHHWRVILLGLRIMNPGFVTCVDRWLFPQGCCNEFLRTGIEPVVCYSVQLRGV